MADPEVWRALIETGNPYIQQERQQKGLMGMMELQEKKRQMEDTQRLRELYSSGKPVSQQDVMAINPDLGIKLQQAGNQAFLQQLQAEELMRKKQEADAKTYAQYVGPVADTYFDDVRSGMPEQQALQKFRSAIGSAQAELEQKHGIKPQADFTQFQPLQILDRTTGLGVPSRHYKSLEEEQKSALQMRERMAPSYGDIKPVWDSTRGQWVSTPQTQMPDFSGASATELNLLEQSLKGMPEGPEKEGLKNFLAQKRGQPTAQTPTGLTPLSEVKAEETKAVESTKAESQRTEEGKRITDAFKRAMGEGGVSRVMKLISESTSGKGEEVLAKARGAVPGLGATAGMENIGALNTIAGELRKTIERSPGAQSDKDVALAALDAAAIADPSIPYNQRMKGFLEFTRIIKERATDLGIDPQSLGINVDTETGSGPVKVKTKAEAEKLSPGTLFETPDGKIMRRH